MNRTMVGFGFMLLSSFFFAVSGPIAKTMYATGWSPGAVVLLRLAGSALILLIPTLLALRGKWGEVVRSWRMVVTYGIVSMVGVQLLYFLAVQELTVAVALLLEMTSPLLIVFWLWITTRIRPATVTFIGMALSLAGLMLILDPSSSHISLSGVLFAMGAAVCLSSYFLVSAKADSGIPPVALTGLGMAVGAVVMAVILLAGVLPADFVLEPVQMGAATVSWMVPLAQIVLFTAGAYVFGIWGLRMVGATVGAFVNLTEVPFSVIVAWLLVAELPTHVQMYGGLGILGGVVFIKWGEVRQTRRIQRPVVLSDPATGPLSLADVQAAASDPADGAAEAGAGSDGAIRTRTDAESASDAEADAVSQHAEAAPERGVSV
jgi:drug/metabolite transporter (DMT)-like permease